MSYAEAAVGQIEMIVFFKAVYTSQVQSKTDPLLVERLSYVFEFGRPEPYDWTVCQRWCQLTKITAENTPVYVIYFLIKDRKDSNAKILNDIIFLCQECWKIESLAF